MEGWSLCADNWEVTTLVIEIVAEKEDKTGFSTTCISNEFYYATFYYINFL